MTPSIAAILSGARKYGLGLVLAHQELDQFPSRESGILGSILTNCHTRVYFQLGDKDAKRLEDGFAHFDANNLRRLKVGEAICRIGGSDGDFSLDCRPLPDAEANAQDIRARAVDASRAAYAVPREDVENADGGIEVVVSEVPRPPRRKQAKPADDSFIESSPIQRPPEPPLPTPPEAFAEIPPCEDKPVRTPGRGGNHHKLLQQAIKQFANGLGLRATIEAPLAGNGGSVDVLVEGQSLKIAFEIADSSPLEQEVRNIQKALDCKIDSIVVVSEASGHLAEIREEAEVRGIPIDRVTFLQSSGIGGYFSSLGATLASYETTSRGYTVRVRQAELSVEEREERLAAIHRAIAEHQREVANHQDPKG